MKPKDKEEILRILTKIKQKSIIAVKGGSGGAKRYAMRDPEIIWELGLALQNAADNSAISEDKRKQWIRRISRKYDSEIIGEGNEWSISAYDWLTHFKQKDHYMFVAKLAGYREDQKQNSFNKRRVRYLRPIYTKLEVPTLPSNKIKQLTKQLEDDQTLRLNDEDYYKIIKKIRGTDVIHWQPIMDSIEELSNLVETATENSNSEQERKNLREKLGDNLIIQLRFALQLCVIDNKNDFEYAYNLAKEKFKKKSKTNYPQFQELFENLKPLIKNFEDKKKRVKKTSYYELEQLNSNLDAIRSEDIYHEYMGRKKALGEVFG